MNKKILPAPDDKYLYRYSDGALKLESFHPDLHSKVLQWISREITSMSHKNAAHVDFS